MNMLPATLATLCRPRLLVRAARFGLADYRRDRDLVRLMQGRMPGSARTVLNWLIEQEERMEEIRQSGDAGYSIARHVELLIALVAEARLICDIDSPRSSG
ncbi:hypothetical protein JMM63_01065 [Rhodovulum sulfidophilum]|uniref:Uncharacterized protein n=2 Tax=Rhodovulum sulfidophilum TaxID=35806 RepID=A0A0D6B336_RHOSU|nr:DUF6477 family protein [Rhodovulum sulfidophilum]MBK5923593.1 hypothetical protein [Rhodovulum sulfidophilum]MBL3550758.1 hypothetical protein [Rhodovulum sulfidophilum]MBL3562861.1 hypothetical protein [Rhodovulum sulfidophilum]MBL3564993.1 hypothetical protein [Rhodovulum sulfidophilum]MBL3573108.1 hypothetical protein [Rhodovulum sulfidophilum]